jgi:hypothetical protein
VPGGPELFESIAPQRWELCAHNPVALLKEASAHALESAANDPAVVHRATEIEELLQVEREKPAADAPSVAYFCAEFGVHRSMPVYSGGLGALAATTSRRRRTGRCRSWRSGSCTTRAISGSGSTRAAGSTSTGFRRIPSFFLRRWSAATTGIR